MSMKTVRLMSRSAVAAVLATSLMVGTTGVASAVEPPASHPATHESATAVYPTPSDEDISLYGTDDPETVYLLNQMSEEFEKYGEKGFYEELIVGTDYQPKPGMVTTLGWDSFASCVGNGLARSFGLDILKRAFNHEVRSALKSRQWKVASAIMHRNISKYLGKKAASIIIKKIASKALPGGLPGQIAWQVGKCGFKEIW